MRDERVQILTYRDFYHVGKTKISTLTILPRFFELSVAYALVFVDESVNNPALPEPFLQGVGVVEGRKPNKSVMSFCFAAGSVNVLATSKSASQLNLRTNIVKYSLDDNAPSARAFASVYVLAYRLNCCLNGLDCLCGSCGVAGEHCVVTIYGISGSCEYIVSQK